MNEIGVSIDFDDADPDVSRSSDTSFPSSLCNFDNLVCIRSNLAFTRRCKLCNFLQDSGSNFGNCSNTGNGINSSAVQNLSRTSI